MDLADTVDAILSLADGWRRDGPFDAGDGRPAAEVADDDWVGPGGEHPAEVPPDPPPDPDGGDSPWGPGTYSVVIGVDDDGEEIRVQVPPPERDDDTESALRRLAQPPPHV